MQVHAQANVLSEIANLVIRIRNQSVCCTYSLQVLQRWWQFAQQLNYAYYRTVDRMKISSITCFLVLCF